MRFHAIIQGLVRSTVGRFSKEQRTNYIKKQNIKEKNIKKQNTLVGKTAQEYKNWLPCSMGEPPCCKVSVAK